jgi:putative ABC transport system permease protein
MDAPRVAIINESLARQLFPDRDPIGRPMPSESPQAPVTTVVGVVRDAAQSTLQEPAKGELYLPYSQYIFGAFLSTVVVRTSVDPVKLGGVLRQEVWAVDRNQPVTKIETMDDVIADSIWRPRFSAWLLSVLGALALALTAAGAYAVVAYTTAMRTRDAAIRVALGASPQRILAETIRFAVVPVLCGIVMSAALAVAVMRVLSSLMYETGTSDPVTYGAASGILVLTSVGASLWPAIRTARADASAMLRAD